LLAHDQVLAVVGVLEALYREVKSSYRLKLLVFCKVPDYHRVVQGAARQVLAVFGGVHGEHRIVVTHQCCYQTARGEVPHHHARVV